MKNRNWHGTDQNREISLFEYGLLVRWVAAQKSWQVIYRNPYEVNTFSFSWVEEKELTQIFIDGFGVKDKEAFLENSCTDWDEWIGLPVYRRIDDIVAYYGAQCLFGDDYSGGDTIKQICKRLKIKYDNGFVK